MTVLNFLLPYIIFEIGFYFYERKGFSIFKGPDSRFVLTDKPEAGGTNLISQFIEYGVLNRYSLFGYKNSVRSNNRILSAIFLTFFLFILCLIFLTVFSIRPTDTFCGNMALGFAAFLISSFVLERQSIHKKWEFLYNQKVQCFKETDTERKEYLGALLIYNIVLQEMWSHRSFKNLVFDYLSKNQDCGYPVNGFLVFEKRTIMNLLRVKIEQKERLTI